MLEQAIIIPSDRESNISKAAFSNTNRDNTKQSDSTFLLINILLKQ
jgi:hypothetical protein